MKIPQSKLILFAVSILPCAGCTVIQSAKHCYESQVLSNKCDESKSEGKKYLSYNTGFSRSIVISSNKSDSNVLEIKSIDSGDQTYDVYYDESPFFSDTFDLKVDDNGRLDTSNVKTTSDLPSILASVTSIVKAGLIPMEDQQKTEECSEKTEEFPVIEINLCKDKQGQIQSIKSKDSVYEVKVDCKQISAPKSLPDSVPGLLVFDSKPVNVSVMKNINWKKDDNKHCVSTTQVKLATAIVVYPDNLHAIPINRNVFTSPETTLVTKGGFFSQYKKISTGFIKGVLDTVTAPIQSLLPKITVTDGKKSSTYSSQ